MSCIAHLVRNIMMKQLVLTTTFLNEPLRKSHHDGGLLYIDGVQVIQEFILDITCSISGFLPLQKFHLSIAKHVKECAFTYLQFDAVRVHLGKPDPDRRLLSSMGTSISRSLNSIPAARERSSSFTELQTDCFHKETSSQLKRDSFE